MGKCQICNREMLKAKSCSSRFRYLYIKMPSGKIKKFKRQATDEEGNELGERCHDCGITMDWKSSIHHYGCDNEYCPSCGNQLLMCDENIVGLGDTVSMKVKFKEDK